MDKEITDTIKKFMDSFEQVFDKDWNYTKEQLGIREETDEQKQNAANMGLDTIHLISPDGTFLNPKVADETEDWGHRAGLLENYRQLKISLSMTETQINNRRESLKFKDGISPTIDHLYQWGTYYGLIEGVPNKTMNARHVRWAQEAIKKHFNLDKLYLITPEEKPIGPPESNYFELPPVTCIAALSHYKPMKDMGLEQSVLGLVWFQDDYAMPIDEKVLKIMRELNWADVSEDDNL